MFQGPSERHSTNDYFPPYPITPEFHSQDYQRPSVGAHLTDVLTDQIRCRGLDYFMCRRPTHVIVNLAHLPSCACLSAACVIQTTLISIYPTRNEKMTNLEDLGR